MVLDDEKQRSTLLAVLSNITLGPGTVDQLKPQIAEVERVITAVRSAGIKPDDSVEV